MLVDSVIGNVHSDGCGRFAGKTHDPLELTWRQCTRRALSGRTASGRDVSLLLPPGACVRHGDVLFDDDVAPVVVEVIPCELWVAEFGDSASMAAAALELGNLHVPVEVGGGRHLVTPPDGPSRGVLDKYAGSWRAEVRRFQPLRATVAGTAVQMAATFRRVAATPPAAAPRAAAPPAPSV